ncbi:hypothetical protein OE88DRAFT_1666716 [Heliocybe sulcata]|uniref:Thioesterase domain-containing protein n=1 Tax=Heliocybe sulcata TaxID=5364 RepID=A0A5C3MNG5_9AGAM|nr:hypothetical protein OE88DRAFT_1666716 [Heliocybe sulcata]
MRNGRGFADSVGGRLSITEISVSSKSEEPSKVEGRVVAEITAQEDMTNGAGYVHGGCLMYLIDNCALLCLASMDKEATLGFPGLSLAIDTVFHAPARQGDQLRIAATTMAIASRIKSARVEVRAWKNCGLAANSRLIVSFRADLGRETPPTCSLWRGGQNGSPEVEDVTGSRDIVMNHHLRVRLKAGLLPCTTIAEQLM